MQMSSNIVCEFSLETISSFAERSFKLQLNELMLKHCQMTKTNKRKEKREERIQQLQMFKTPNATMLGLPGVRYG